MTRAKKRSGLSHWTPDDIDRIERAIIEGARIQLSRRGTEFIIVPRVLTSKGASEVLTGTTNAGNEVNFALEEVERFEVIW